MMKTKIAALVLAGGKSSRMGRDKALIPWKGIPMLDRVCSTANICCDRVYIITPRVTQYQTILKQDYFFLEESSQGRGPIIAFAEGLSQINRVSYFDWILLLACDLPKLQVEILQSWIQYLDGLPANIVALVPQNKDRQWEPLCAFYRPKILSDLEQFIDRGGNSFQVWLSSVSVKPIFMSSEENLMLWNCNTSSDLKQETID